MKFMEYVKATTIEERAQEYQNKGYNVVVSPIDVSFPFETRAQSYDIVAKKDGRKRAIEVVPWPKLAQEARKIAERRRQALQEGFDEFRLIVVREPRQFPVKVEGIEQELLTYLKLNMLDELAQLSDQVRVLNVETVTIDSISITATGSRVVGHGFVIVDIYYNENGERFWEDDYFPLNFEVTLDDSLHLLRVHEIVADTSSFYI